jgi:PAS domain S-box-containing protein
LKKLYLLYRPFQTAIILIALCLIIFSIFTLANKVWNDVSNLKTAKSDNVHWMLSQLEVDYLNLRTEQETVISGKHKSLSELRNKFDVFYSRVTILRQGSPFKILRDDQKTGKIVNDVWSFLQNSTELIDSDDQTLFENIDNFSLKTSDLASELRSLALRGVELVANASEQRREGVSQTLLLIAGLSLFLFAALLLMLWVFLRQYRHMKNHANDSQIVSNRLKAVVTSSLDGVIVINRDAKILEFNGAAEDIFGYTKHEAVGGDLAEMIIPVHLRQAHRDGMQRYLDTNEKRVVGKGRLRLEAKRKSDEVFPIELSISSAESKDGEVFVAFLRDISDLVQGEEELKQARDDALAGEKAKAQLLAVMSHEMRTPLNGMLGTLELMYDSPLSAKQEQYLDIINTSGKMLLHHVNDVLNISRLDSGKFETELNKFDITKLMNQLCDSQRQSAATKGNEISTDFVSLKGQIVVGDDLRLQQVLLNILGNAIKFTRDGKISVEAERKEGDIIEIRISDTGIGIDEADLDRIFEDFVTLDSSYGRTEAGTGLGLGITKRMIAAMNGSIGVESVKGDGSLFWVRLSLPEFTEDEIAEETSDITDTSAIIPQRILVVEDNSINRFVVREMLEKDGHTVIEVKDGVEGVAICKQQTFDTILMDISMPRLDGVEATKIIRESGGPSAKTPIIALTAHALPEEIIKFNKVGMNDTLIKPISSVSLRNAIQMATNNSKKTALRPNTDEHVQVIDHKTLNEIKNTLDTEKYEALLQKFIGESDMEIDWISSSNGTTTNTTEFVKRVHNLAGSASLFGAVQLRDVLFQIETICKTKKPDELDQYINRLPEIWEITKTSLLA